MQCIIVPWKSDQRKRADFSFGPPESRRYNHSKRRGLPNAVINRRLRTIVQAEPLPAAKSSGA